jgi:protein TonB
MAPQAIDEKVPNILPADFDEWEDGARPPATLPDDFFDDIDAHSAPTTVATPQTVVAPVLKKALETPAAPVVAKAPVATASTKSAKSSKASKQAKSHAAYTETRAVPVPIAPVKSTVEPEKKSKDNKETKKSSGKGIAIGAALLVLVSAGIFVPRVFMKSPAKTVLASQPVVTQPTSTSPVPAPSLAQTKPTPSTPLEQQAAATQTAQQSRSVDSAKMVDQLVAPSRISQNINNSQKETGSSQNFSASGMEGLGGAPGAAVGAVLSGTPHPKVNFEAPKSLNISSGVASGLLLQKRDPVYPPLAKQSNVAGTVVMEATISKTGAIQGLHVLSGPVMLRQAAMDAVGQWRYRPYMLDSQPVDVQTTINVTFSLGR